MKLSEIYSTLSELNEMVKYFERCESGCAAHNTYEVTLKRATIGDLERTSKKSRDALKALLDELEIGNKQN